MAKIENLRLEPADNGFVVCWTECKRSDTGGTFGNSTYDYHEEVFKDDESEKAIGKFKDLRKKMRGIADSEEVSEKGDY